MVAGLIALQSLKGLDALPLVHLAWTSYNVAPKSPEAVLVAVAVLLPFAPLPVPETSALTIHDGAPAGSETSLLPAIEDAVMAPISQSVGTGGDIA